MTRVIYTTVPGLEVFLKEVKLSEDVYLIYKYSTQTALILWNIIKIEKELLSIWIYVQMLFFLWCKAELSVSHDPSEIILIYWFAAQETFLILNVENSCAT